MIFLEDIVKKLRIQFNIKLSFGKEKAPANADAACPCIVKLQHVIANRLIILPPSQKENPSSQFPVVWMQIFHAVERTAWLACPRRGSSLRR
jgi:hypothetical protein